MHVGNPGNPKPLLMAVLAIVLLALFWIYQSTRNDHPTAPRTPPLHETK